MQDEPGRRFPPLPFEKMNEADVREEVITPLLHQLGYKTGNEHNIVREQSLRYTKSSLGRKDPKKDPKLRGTADYVVEVGLRLRWLIEAKPPEPEMSIDDIEQAYTYANHPEIRAVYFVLCNGRRLTIYQTINGPTAEAVLSLSYQELESKFQYLINLLSPQSLVRDFPQVKIDIHPPIAPDLRSMARITNGLIRYEHNSQNLTILNELQIGIANGTIERGEISGLAAYIESTVPFQSLQELNERLGLAKFEMISADTELSANPETPTVFAYRNTIILPEGEEVLDISTWNLVKLPRNVTCDVSATAKGVYSDRRFSGAFESSTLYRELGKKLDLSGVFVVNLS